MGRIFCFGLGYSARFLAARLLRERWTVAGTTRAAGAAAELAALGFAMHVFDAPAPLADPVTALAGTTHLLISVPPTAAGDPVLAVHGAALARLDSVVWAGYLSSTAVYGDHGGGWVDETTPPRPGTGRGRQRLAAEAAWRDSGLPIHIFRVASIYGPGRNPLAAVKDGTARRIAKPGQVFSRIHVADLAAALCASMARPRPGAIYNLADDLPAASAEVLVFAARLLGRPAPPVVPLATARLSATAQSFYAESKRVANRRIKDELGVRLLYPTYREGLAALAAADA